MIRTLILILLFLVIGLAVGNSIAPVQLLEEQVAPLYTKVFGKAIPRIPLETVALPAPRETGPLSVEEALRSRRSVRAYDNTPLTRAELSQMLWAAQGETDEYGHRSAPSAHSAYPITLLAALSNVEGVEEGLYEYDPKKHELVLLQKGEQKTRLAAVTGQPQPQGAPATLYVVGDVLKLADYATPSAARGSILLEAGHIGQNLYLEAESLGLGMVVMGGFDPKKARTELALPWNESVVYLIPFGHEAPSE